MSIGWVDQFLMRHFERLYKVQILEHLDQLCSTQLLHMGKNNFLKMPGLNNKSQLDLNFGYCKNTELLGIG